MYKYGRVLTVLLVVALLASAFALSASTEAVDGSVVPELSGDGSASSVEAGDAVTTGEATLEETNEYLRYISAFLLFLCVCVLIWAAYKFIAMFF